LKKLNSDLISLLPILALGAVIVFIFVDVDAAGSAPRVQTQNLPASVSHSSPTQLISFTRLMSLSQMERLAYVDGVRELMEAINAVQNLDGTEYEKPESIASNWLLNSISSGFLQNASADSAARACVYAGWVTTYSDGDKYCKTPPACKDRKKLIACQPLLYGNKCVSPGRMATANCESSAVSLNPVAKYINSHPDEWSKLRSDVGNMCETGRQAKVCAMIRNRILRLNSRITKAPAVVPLVTPPADPEVVTSVTSLRRNGTADVNVATPVSILRPQGHTRAQMDHKREELSLANSVPSNGKCYTSHLLSDIDSYAGTATNLDKSESALNFTQAQSLYCDRDLIDNNLIDSRRNAILNKINLAHSLPHASSNIGQLTGILQNFDVCVAEARKFRIDQIPPRHGSRVKVRFSDSQRVAEIVPIDVNIIDPNSDPPQYLRKTQVLSGGVAQPLDFLIGGQLQGDGVDLCDAQNELKPIIPIEPNPPTADGIR
jgi:hypothetical protein